MILASLAVAAFLQSQPAVPVHRYDGLALSPDGKEMATFESSIQTGSQAVPHAVVTLRKADGEVMSQVDPCPACRYDAAAWSPDGKTLAFLADDQKAGTATLYVLENGAARAVTKVEGVANRPRWSPDGKTIALLAVVGAHKQTGATQAGAAQVGEIGIASAIDEQRIVTVPLSGGDLTFISPSDTFVYEYDWTPDGLGFVATAAKGDGDNNWWTASLEAFPLSGDVRVLLTPKMQMNFPKVTADGKNVLFIGGLMSDFGAVGGDVYSLPLSGGDPVDLTPDYKGSFTSLALTGSGVIAGVILGGDTGIAHIDATSGKVDILSQGAYLTSAGEGRISLDASGKKAAAVVESFTTAQTIEIGSPGALKAVTHDNDAATVPFTAQSVTWTNEGFSVQGWLMAPLNVVAGKTYPMVTVVHGGPSAAVTPRYTAAGTVYELLQAGYYVFQPNPRGSYGQGEAFTSANKRDFGGGDLRDILAGIDAVEKVAPVDDKRLGMYGHSYGGLMSMWTVTQTQRFHAVVAGAGIANWSSYYGENGIDQWMIPFFGASFYDDPAIYDKLSPIRYIKNAKTPTFIYVGERDVECPAPQSMEFWHGLKDEGVPTSLVIYEGEGHGIRLPEHNADLSKRILGWFSQYLGQT